MLNFLSDNYIFYLGRYIYDECMSLPKSNFITILYITRHIYFICIIVIKTTNIQLFHSTRYSSSTFGLLSPPNQYPPPI